MKRYSRSPGTRIFTLEFHRPWPSLGVGPGQYLAVNTAVPFPFRVLACHPIQPDPGDILAAIAEGAGELTNPRVTVFELAAALEKRG